MNLSPLAAFPRVQRIDGKNQCKIRLDVEGEPGVCGILHLTSCVLGHWNACSAVIYDKEEHCAEDFGQKRPVS